MLNSFINTVLFYNLGAGTRPKEQNRKKVYFPVKINKKGAIVIMSTVDFRISYNFTYNCIF